MQEAYLKSTDTLWKHAHWSETTKYIGGDFQSLKAVSMICISNIHEIRRHTALCKLVQVMDSC